MSDLTELSERAAKLPLAERLALVEAILESLTSSNDQAWSTAWAQEAESRAAAFDLGEISAVDAETVISDIRARYAPR